MIKTWKEPIRRRNSRKTRKWRIRPGTERVVIDRGAAPDKTLVRRLQKWMPFAFRLEAIYKIFHLSFHLSWCIPTLSIQLLKPSPWCRVSGFNWSVYGSNIISDWSIVINPLYQQLIHHSKQFAPVSVFMFFFKRMRLMFSDLRRTKFSIFKSRERE